MYIPKINLATDRAEIIDFMKRFSFATIITSKNNLPVATHLPFVISEKDENLVLISHFAKANNQWEDIESNTVLIIFTEPHAYISPANYTKELNVPTWNYISVHAYGKGKIISDTESTYKILESTIASYEPGYRKQWDHFPEEYKLKMSKGIVAFEITVNDLHAKKKLSQNRSETEQQNIINNLSGSKDDNERIIADYMKHNQDPIK